METIDTILSVAFVFLIILVNVIFPGNGPKAFRGKLQKAKNNYDEALQSGDTAKAWTAGRVYYGLRNYHQIFQNDEKLITKDIAEKKNGAMPVK